VRLGVQGGLLTVKLNECTGATLSCCGVALAVRARVIVVPSKVTSVVSTLTARGELVPGCRIETL